MKALIKKYNAGQKEYKIGIGEALTKDGLSKGIDFSLPQPVCIIKLNSHESYRDIGFYEWLFNPKYKVFEVLDNLKLSLNRVITVKRVNKGYANEYWYPIPMKPKRIINLINKWIKEYGGG